MKNSNRNEPDGSLDAYKIFSLPVLWLFVFANLLLLGNHIDFKMADIIWKGNKLTRLYRNIFNIKSFGMKTQSGEEK